MRKLLFITGIVFIVIGGLAYIFFFGVRSGSYHTGGYSGSDIPYPFLWVAGAVVLLWLGRKLITRDTQMQAAGVEEEQNKERNDLITHGEVIVADLDKCEIKTNNYSHTVQVSTQPYGGMQDEEVIQRVVQSVLIYECIYKGAKIKFTSDVLRKERETIMFYLASRKTINIYVDPDKPSRHYFDLDFLQ